MGPTPTVLSVSCGSAHTVALLDCGTVVSFGKGEDGQLGHGDAQSAAQPRAVVALRGKGISSVSCGAEYSIAVSQEHRQIYSWGWGDFGRLGHGHALDCFSPQPVAALAGVAIRQVACGDAHTLVVTDAGELYAFGRNQNGQLGVGSTEDVHAPRRVDALQHVSIVSAAAGAEHSVVATSSGQVYSFGWGKYGCLGDGSREDRHIPVLTLGLEGVHVAQVACGWRHSLAVSDASKLYSFGWGRFGQIGHGDNEDRLVAAEVAALASVPVARVAGGWRHTVAADADGNAYAWGWGKFGQLGLGDTADRNLPTRVTGALEGRRVELVACGWRHTVVTAADGTVWSWGRGTNHQLGHGTDEDTATPTQVDPAALARAAADAGPLPAGADGGAGAAAFASGGVPAGAPAGAAADRFAVVPEEAAGDGAGAGGGDGGGGGAFAGGGGNGFGGGGGGGGGGAGDDARKKPRLDAADAAVPGG